MYLKNSPEIGLFLFLNHVLTFWNILSNIH